MKRFTRQQAIHLFSIRDTAHLKALFGEIAFQQRAQTHIVINDQNFVVLLHVQLPKAPLPEAIL